MIAYMKDDIVPFGVGLTQPEIDRLEELVHRMRRTCDRRASRSSVARKAILEYLEKKEVEHDIVSQEQKSREKTSEEAGESGDSEAGP